MDVVAGHLLNPGVLLTLALAGVAYGAFLWMLRIYPALTLWVAATAPGAIFLATIWVIRVVQATPSIVWPVLLVDWFIYAGIGVLTVLAGRRWMSR